MVDVLLLVALPLVAIGFFSAGVCWEVKARQRREEQDRMHGICAGSYYVLDRQSPFDGEIKVRVLCIRDGWVQYKFTDSPNVRPDSTTIRDFLMVYKPAIGL